MARSYYGVPGVSPDEDDSYYYEYEPILVEKSKNRNSEDPISTGIEPGHVIIFIMGLPFLPIWSLLAIFGTLTKIAYFQKRNPDRLPELQFLLKAFITSFFIGVLLYWFFIPKIMNIYYSIP